MNLDGAVAEVELTANEVYTLMFHAEHNGAYVVHIRGKMCHTLNRFFCEISSAMRFPWYFGWNWPAFDECITDLEWLSFSSLLIVIDDYNLIFQDERLKKEYLNLLIKHLKIAVEYWISQNIQITVYLNRQL